MDFGKKTRESIGQVKKYKKILMLIIKLRLRSTTSLRKYLNNQKRYLATKNSEKSLNFQ